jgi:hypothetical protein
MPETMTDRIRDACRAVGLMFYGASVYDWVREVQKQRGELERFFVLVVFGDMIGIPILPPYYALRLIPYTVPKLESWKRCILRERDLTDLFDSEIG